MDSKAELQSYCICKGLDDGRPMINCDNCNNWYHFECIKLDESTAAEIDSFICESCSTETNQKTAYAWELTDEELSFAPRPSSTLQTKQTSKKSRSNPITQPKKLSSTPPIPAAKPTFATHESDSDIDMHADDGEYTGEHQLTRLRRGRNTQTEDGMLARTPSPQSKLKKRKAPTAVTSAAKRKKTNPLRSPSPLSDPVRKYCYGKLYEVIEPIFIQYHGEGEESLEAASKSLASQFVTELENTVYNQYSEPDKKGIRSAGAKYKERFRMLTFNLAQADRVSLRRRIGTGSLPASELSEMSSAELANEQAKQDMEKAAQEALHQSILKDQTALPRAKITHKGEEIIENNASEDHQRVREEEDRARLRSRMRIRTGSILENNSEYGSGIASALGVSSSTVGEHETMEFESPTPTSPVRAAFHPAVHQPPILSPVTSISPVAAVSFITSPVRETGLPNEDPRMSPRAGLSAPRPSFDLNSLWSGGTNENKDSHMTSETVPTQQYRFEETEEPMELDDDAIEEKDFGMFLTDIEEKIITPPPATPVVEKDTLAKLPVVWSGELIMPLDPAPPVISSVSVKQVGGRPLGVSASVWGVLFKNGKSLIEGRVPTDRSTKYLLTTRLNAGKELVVVQFISEGESSAKMKEIFDLLVAKDRHGLIFPWGAQPPATAPGKDLYLIPQRASQPLPEFIELLDHVSIPKNRDKDMLLGVFVLSKGKLVVPVEAPVQPIPAPVAWPNESVATILSSVLAPGAPPAQIPPFPMGVPPPALPPFPPTLPSAAGLPLSFPPPSALAPVPQAPSISTDALAALSSEIKNMSSEQMNLILRGLSLVAPNQPASAHNWVSPIPPPTNYQPTGNPPYNQYGSGPSQPSNRSPQSQPMHQDRNDRLRDKESGHHRGYSRDMDRRPSSPSRRGGRQWDRDDRRDRGRGPRGRGGHGGSPYDGKNTDGGWGSMRPSARTGADAQ